MNKYRVRYRDYNYNSYKEEVLAPSEEIAIFVVKTMDAKFYNLQSVEVVD